MTIAIDFDGTLHSGLFPNIGDPVKDAISSVRELHGKGHFIILYTCRSGDKLAEAVNWCLKNGIPFDAVNGQNPERLKLYGSDTRKISADIYIDDQQIGGLPPWKRIMELIDEKEVPKLRFDIDRHTPHSLSYILENFRTEFCKAIGISGNEIKIQGGISEYHPVGEIVKLRLPYTSKKVRCMCVESYYGDIKENSDKYVSLKF